MFERTTTPHGTDDPVAPQPAERVMRISPKSGSPVLGHTEVNSGQRIAIS